MEHEHRYRFISYSLFLASALLILFVLDRFFGFHYAPDEHRLNQKPKVESSVKSHGEAAAPAEKKETIPEEQPEFESTVADPEQEPQETSEVQPARNNDFFQTLKANYQTKVLSQLPPNKARTDIVIRYYQHAPDGNSAYALQKLGFYIHERPVDPELANYQSNAIYFGENVKLEDIQIVTFTLLSEGLPVKLIKPSRFGDSWKSNAIEIGTDTTLINQPTLTLSEIENLSI
ncbi:MAG: hypothetical protein RIC30_18000 [Marinoscillum sp.]|uniref:hypothetical protein n=1 Tax=Marinoscillum sp. TaxID=2024838 RepID=UPI0032FCF04C